MAHKTKHAYYCDAVSLKHLMFGCVDKTKTVQMLKDVQFNQPCLQRKHFQHEYKWKP